MCWCTLTHGCCAACSMVIRCSGSAHMSRFTRCFPLSDTFFQARAGNEYEPYNTTQNTHQHTHNTHRTPNTEHTTATAGGRRRVCGPALGSYPRTTHRDAFLLRGDLFHLLQHGLIVFSIFTREGSRSRQTTSTTPNHNTTNMITKSNMLLLNV